MKPSIQKIVFITIINFLISACSILPSRNASLQINTEPQASVFIDGEKAGVTPFFTEKIKEGEYTIKLIPEDGVGLPWEKRLRLTSGIQTKISRKLASAPDQSNGYDLSMHPSFTDKSSLIILSEPENAIIKINGQTKGFTPLEIEDIGQGEYTIEISSPGYIERTLRTEIFPKFKVNIYAQLAKSEKYLSADNLSADQEISTNSDSEPESSQSAQILDQNLDSLDDEVSTSTDQDLNPPFVTINETPTGWLNIRSQPTTVDDNIIKKANPGEKYPYIDQNETGWYKVEIQNGQVGWLSSRYVSLTQ